MLKVSIPRAGRVVAVKRPPPAQANAGALVRPADYDAAGRTRRTIATQATIAGPNTVMGGSVNTLMVRSRAEQRNNAWLRGLARRLVANTIGLGIRPRFQTGDVGLDREMRLMFEEWTPKADADGKKDYYGLQTQGFQAMVESGEVFNRFRTRDPSTMTVPLQIQALEREYVPLEKNERRSNGNEIKQGIEFNSFGRCVTYHMRTHHPGDIKFFDYNYTETIPVRASEVVHLFDILNSRPGTFRGEPWFAQVLVRAHDLNRYDAYELTRKKAVAGVIGAIVRNAPTDTTLDELKATWGAVDEDPTGLPAVPLEGGTMLSLALGEDIKFSEPGEVGGSYDDFQMWQLRAIAAATGIPYEVLSGDYSKMNDRTFRAAILEFRRIAEVWQEQLVIQLMCRPVVERWIRTAVAVGALRPPRQVDERMLYRVRHVPPAWAYIHPVQDVQATRDAVLAGFTSRTEETIRGGYEPEEVEAEVAAENARADRFGFVFSSDGRHTKPPEPPPGSGGGTSNSG